MNVYAITIYREPKWALPLEEVLVTAERREQALAFVEAQCPGRLIGSPLRVAHNWNAETRAFQSVVSDLYYERNVESLMESGESMLTIWGWGGFVQASTLVIPPRTYFGDVEWAGNVSTFELSTQPKQVGQVVAIKTDDHGDTWADCRFQFTNLPVDPPISSAWSRPVKAGAKPRAPRHTAQWKREIGRKGGGR